ncbi:hypothetical protein V2J09_009934 [Rumex salicifolius]
MGYCHRWLWGVGFMVVLAASDSNGITDSLDVFAINSLYAALGSPPLPGWVPIGGDPCMEAWQGVLCVNANITGISLNGANLGGELGTNLGSFTSIISIDLSNNHIGGTIPSNLPPTIKSFILAGNQFSGSLPDGLSMLSQLTDLSFSNNSLTGEIPDSFQQLTGLISLDLSENNLTGPLPPSMANLSSLTTFHLQDNKLTGTLNVLQDLPLIDLNIENNLFSGPIPPRLLTISNFRNSGNPFNTSIILPSSPAASPALSPNSPLPSKPSPDEEPEQQQATGQSASEPFISANSTKAKLVTAKTIVWSAIVVLLVLAGIALGFFLCVLRCGKKRQGSEKIILGREKSVNEQNWGKPKYSETLPQTYNQTDFLTASKVKVANSCDGGQIDSNKVINAVAATKSTRSKNSHTIDMTGIYSSSISKPKPPPRQYSAQKENIKPSSQLKTSTIVDQNMELNSPGSVKSFTVAFLQECTNSFSQENRIGEGMLGSVYRAELPDGKLVAVKKLNAAVSKELNDKEFVKLLSTLSQLQHDNVVNLVGYCAEYGQKLIIYEYCNYGTLFDALYFDDEIHQKMSWNARINIALGAARALEYMHEICQPPVIHKNFKAINVLLDQQLTPRISDCGFAALFTDNLRNQLSQLSSSGYGAPELELGSYTHQSDVFSFGVVMLELLTGRKSFDRSRPRGDQLLVKWAVPRLHDIDSLSKMVDPSLNGAYPSKSSLSRFADIISLCLQAEPEFRPPMSEIVQRLLNMLPKET